MGKNDSINYDNLTYGDILSTIKKLGINMCNDEKLLKHQLKNKRKAKYEMGNFCEQYGLPPIAHSRQKGKKHDKTHKNCSYKKYKKYRTNFVKPNDFYAKKKNVSKKYDKQRSGKGKCFNCGKPRHYSKDCKQKPSKLKNKFNMLNINDDDQEDLSLCYCLLGWFYFDNLIFNLILLCFRLQPVFCPLYIYLMEKIISNLSSRKCFSYKDSYFVESLFQTHVTLQSHFYAFGAWVGTSCLYTVSPPL